MFSYDDYLSPLTWRYGTPEMRALWSEAGKHRLWRKLWVALAETQRDVGLVTHEQVSDLRAHIDDVDLERAHAIEARIHHDLMAEVHTFAEQALVGGPIIHLGATSMDIEDNADALRLRNALVLIESRLRAVLLLLAERIEDTADTATMGFTHLQPAEPTTMGYRLAQYGQDLLTDLQEIRLRRQQLRGKGFKGAVGTSASYGELLAGTDVSPEEFERQLMDRLDLEPMLVANQVVARKQEYHVVSALAGLGQSLYRFAFDLRLLQSPTHGEWAEPFGKHQVGSSAMPFKRNPINAENMNSLGRLLASLPRVTWDNAAHCLLERTLDDSANRRLVLPQAFLLTDEMLRRARRLLSGLQIHEAATARLLDTYGPFAATERVMMEAAKAGGDRQALHELIRGHAMTAWAAVQRGDANPLLELICEDPTLTQLLDADTLRDLMDASDYVGDAPQRARRLAAAIRQALAEESQA